MTLNEGIMSLDLPKNGGLAGVMKNCKYLDDETFCGEVDVWDNLIGENVAGIIFMRKTAESKLSAVVEVIIKTPKIKDKIAILDGKTLTEPITIGDYQEIRCKIKEAENATN